MKDNIFQCCYTNSERNMGGRVTSGWEKVAYSKNIPSEALTRCEKLQKVNSSFTGGTTDEDGNVLNLLEICSDNKFVYILRTQYGLTDREGRANLFSHAYILWWKDVLSDPNAFLQVTDRSNFKTSESEAQQLLDDPDWVPGALYKEYTITSAMEKAGITAESFPVLIRCVYAQLSGYTDSKPVYVRYEDESQLPAILFCIYYGLPYHLRKKLNIATAAKNTTSKNLIFSRAVDNALYIDPRTGENSVLDRRLERRIAKLGFIDYAAGHLEDTDYLLRLTEEAAGLGDRDGADEHFLKIAHRKITGQPVSGYTEDELTEFLGDALRSKAYESSDMVAYISEILDRTIQEKLRLPKEYRAKLTGWKTFVALSTDELQEKKRLEQEHKERVDAAKRDIDAQLDRKYAEIEATRLDEAERNTNGALENKLSALEEKTRETQEKYVAELKAKGDSPMENIKQLWRKLPSQSLTEQIKGLEDIAVYFELMGRIASGTIDPLKKVKEDNTAERKELEERTQSVLDQQRETIQCSTNAEKAAEQAEKHKELESEMEAHIPEELKRINGKVRFSEIADQYIITFFGEILSQDEAANELAQLPADLFEQYSDLLLKKNATIFECYFEAQLHKQDLSWEQLSAVLKNAKRLKASPKWLKEIEKLSSSLYRKQLNEDVKNAKEAYDQYMEISRGLTSPSAHYEQSAKQEFWKNLSLQDYSLTDKFPEFRKMDPKSERCKMFDSFNYLIKSVAAAREEDILKNVQDFFSIFHSEFRENDRTTALNLICEAIGGQAQNRSAYFLEWVKLIAGTENDRSKEILAIRAALEPTPQYENFLSCHKNLFDKKTGKNDTMIRRVDEIAFKICCEADSNAAPVPLDVWLTIGKAILEPGKNVFSIFENAAFSEKRAAIFKCQNASVVSGSNLLGGCAEEAERYVNSRGKEYKAVKDWLTQLRKGDGTDGINVFKSFFSKKDER